MTAEDLPGTLADSLAAETVETPAQIQIYRELAKYLNAAKDRADLKARTAKQDYKLEIEKLSPRQIEQLRDVYGKRWDALDLAGAM